MAIASADWHHLAFVYDAASRPIEALSSTANSKPCRRNANLSRLQPGEEDYLSIGRDGDWQRPLPGRIDEFRISDTQVYRDEFSPPTEFFKIQPRRLQAAEIEGRTAAAVCTS